MTGSKPPPRPTDPAPPADPRPSRRGPRIAAVAFLGFVIPWVAYVSGQVVVQGIYPEVIPAPWMGCSAGREELARSLASAREASEQDLDPDESLRRFRDRLTPTWKHLEAVRIECSSPEDRLALDALERLRYAEEHAVRREAASLARLRRTVSETLESSRRASPTAGSPRGANDRVSPLPAPTESPAARPEVDLTGRSTPPTNPPTAVDSAERTAAPATRAEPAADTESQ